MEKTKLWAVILTDDNEFVVDEYLAEYVHHPHFPMYTLVEKNGVKIAPELARVFGKCNLNQISVTCNVVFTDNESNIYPFKIRLAQNRKNVFDHKIKTVEDEIQPLRDASKKLEFLILNTK